MKAKESIEAKLARLEAEKQDKHLKSMMITQEEIDELLSEVDKVANDEVEQSRRYNIGSSDYAKYKIQPWDIWLEYNLNPWDADIIKRVLRVKQGQSRAEEYQKIIHICKERLRQIKEKGN